MLCTKMDFSNEAIIPNRHIDKKTYQNFLEELRSEARANPTLVNLEKMDVGKIEEYDDCYLIFDKMEKIMEKLDQDIDNSDKFMLALALSIGLTFNLRGGLSESTSDDHLAVFTLKTENIISCDDQMVTLAFVGKCGTTCNKREKLSPKIFKFLVAILKKRTESGDKNLFLDDNSKRWYQTSFIVYFRSLSDTPGTCFSIIKKMNSTMQMRAFLIHLNAQSLTNMELLEKMELFLYYLSTQNDHSRGNFIVVLGHYVDPRLILGFLKIKNIHPKNIYSEKKTFESIFWAYEYLESEIGKDDKRFVF